MAHHFDQEEDELRHYNHRSASVNYVTKHCVNCVPYALATIWTDISIKREIHFATSCRLQIAVASCKENSC